MKLPKIKKIFSKKVAKALKKSEKSQNHLCTMPTFDWSLKHVEYSPSTKHSVLNVIVTVAKIG